MIKYYNSLGFLGLIRLCINFLRGKLLIRNSRIIRFPVDIRGKKYMIFGKGLTTGVGNRLQVDVIKNNKPQLSIGENVQINDYCHIACVNNITIGNDVLIASKVFITDHDHGKYIGDNQDSPLSVPSKREINFSHVVIKDRVWIGENVVILPGVTIGEGSIIGASSIVTKSVPENSLVVGNPARILKKYNFNTNQWELLK